jgi:hypothetical protein
LEVFMRRLLAATVAAASVMVGAVIAVSPAQALTSPPVSVAEEPAVTASNDRALADCIALNNADWFTCSRASNGEILLTSVWQQMKGGGAAGIPEPVLATCPLGMWLSDGQFNEHNSRKNVPDGVEVRTVDSTSRAFTANDVYAYGSSLPNAEGAYHLHSWNPAVWQVIDIQWTIHCAAR